MASNSPPSDAVRARSPRAHVSLQNCAANVVFPVPDVPLTWTVLPLKKPPSPSIESRPLNPDDTLSVETSYRHSVVPGAAKEQVDATLAEQRVVARFAEEHVRA